MTREGSGKSPDQDVDPRRSESDGRQQAVAETAGKPAPPQRWNPPFSQEQLDRLLEVAKQTRLLMLQNGGISIVGYRDSITGRLVSEEEMMPKDPAFLEWYRKRGRRLRWKRLFRPERRLPF